MTQSIEKGDTQRRRVLLTLILITFAGGLFFGVLNWARGLVWAAMIEFAFVIYCLVAFPMVWKTRRLTAWALSLVLPWTAAMLAIVAMPGAAETVFIWPFVLPLLFYFLLGERLGLLLSASSLLAAAVIALQRFGLPANAEQYAHAGNLFVAGLAMVLLAHVYERSRRRVERSLQDMAATDALTGLANRSLLYQDFERMKRTSQRNGTPLAVLLIDLDHFKRINDQHGHDAGDRMLVAVADLLRRRLRGSDRAYRMGGEELLVLLPDTDPVQARVVADALRVALAEMRVPHSGEKLQITASIGIATLGADGDSLREILHQADARLYWCKSHGRNCVRAF